ncbi:hypothetical protein QE152_g38444 [Popillia japonica]|uniref:Uncharacterized protein n=1 Tax=Popillia japonica TaxID=7064 RepID=A0AAW1HXV9_POPJA
MIGTVRSKYARLSLRVNAANKRNLRTRHSCTRENTRDWSEALQSPTIERPDSDPRKLARLLRQQTEGTGGGPSTDKRLSEMEEKMLNLLLHPITIDGAPGIAEPGLIPQAVDVRSRAKVNKRKIAFINFRFTQTANGAVTGKRK